MVNRWIVDTSVVAAWFFTDEPFREASLLVQKSVGSHPESFFVPALFFSELAHVLARKSAGDGRFVTEALQVILRLGLRTLHLSESALLRLPYWTCSVRLSGYDATFIALAEDINARWITADEKAAKRAGRQVAVSLENWKSVVRT